MPMLILCIAFALPAYGQMDRSEVLSKLALIHGPTNGSVVETRTRMGALIDGMIAQCRDIYSPQRAGDVSVLLHDELEKSGKRDSLYSTMRNFLSLSEAGSRYAGRPIACSEFWAAYVVLRQQGTSPIDAVAAIVDIFRAAAN